MAFNDSPLTNYTLDVVDYMTFDLPIVTIYLKESRLFVVLAVNPSQHQYQVQQYQFNYPKEESDVLINTINFTFVEPISSLSISNEFLVISSESSEEKGTRSLLFLRYTFDSDISNDEAAVGGRYLLEEVELLDFSLDNGLFYQLDQSNTKKLHIKGIKTIKYTFTGQNINLGHFTVTLDQYSQFCETFFDEQFVNNNKNQIFTQCVSKTPFRILSPEKPATQDITTDATTQQGKDDANIKDLLEQHRQNITEEVLAKLEVDKWLDELFKDVKSNQTKEQERTPESEMIFDVTFLEMGNIFLVALNVLILGCSGFALYKRSDSQRGQKVISKADYDLTQLEEEEDFDYEIEEEEEEEEEEETKEEGLQNRYQIGKNIQQDKVKNMYENIDFDDEDILEEDQYEREVKYKHKQWGIKYDDREEEEEEDYDDDVIEEEDEEEEEDYVVSVGERGEVGQEQEDMDDEDHDNQQDDEENPQQNKDNLDQKLDEDDFENSKSSEEL